MRSERFIQLLGEMQRIHEAKNAGYAGRDNPDPWANFRMSEMFNIPPVDGVFVRMSDKFIRVANLRKDAKNDQVNESMKDTLIDLANYCLIAVALLEEEEDEKELEAEQLTFIDALKNGLGEKLHPGIDPTLDLKC